jgi:hypothetical protein
MRTLQINYWQSPASFRPLLKYQQLSTECVCVCVCVCSSTHLLFSIAATFWCRLHSSKLSTGCEGYRKLRSGRWMSFTFVSMLLIPLKCEQWLGLAPQEGFLLVPHGDCRIRRKFLSAVSLCLQCFHSSAVVAALWLWVTPLHPSTASSIFSRKYAGSRY